MLVQKTAEVYRPPSSHLKATFGHTEGHAQNSSVQHPNIAMGEQSRQSLRAALAEIEELKQSQRVVEISLAKQIEEKEALKHLLNEQEKKVDVSRAATDNWKGYALANGGQEARAGRGQLPD